jgi:hypothetical protein
MNYEKIELNGNYLYTGFEVERLPQEINKGEENEQKIIGSMNIFFRRDNQKFYVNNENIFESSEENPLGVWQEYNKVENIRSEFFISVEDGICNIVALNIIKRIEEEEGKRL